MSDNSFMPLPEKVNPALLARQRAQLKGTVLLKELPRLSDLLIDQSGEVLVSLAFDRQDKFPKTLVTGMMSVTLQLICQRCGKPVAYDIKLAPKLAVVHNDTEAADVIDQFDPLLVENEVLILRDMVEEELLLGLPAVAKHSQQDCNMLN